MAASNKTESCPSDTSDPATMSASDEENETLDAATMSASDEESDTSDPATMSDIDEGNETFDAATMSASDEESDTSDPATMSARDEENETLDAAAMSVSDEENTQNDELLQRLKCPVCFDISRPPIYKCANGHLVCKECQQNRTHCPTCDAPGRPTARSPSLEEIAHIVRLPCANSSDGCTVELDAKGMVKHWKTCKNKYKFFCEICKKDGQKFNRQELMGHVKKKHHGRFSEEECTLHNLNILDENDSYYTLESRYDELFWIKCLVYGERSKVRFWVHLVGHGADTAKKYECKFKYYRPTADGEPVDTCSFIVQVDTNIPCIKDSLSRLLVDGHFRFTSRIIRK